MVKECNTPSWYTNQGLCEPVVCRRGKEGGERERKRKKKERRGRPKHGHTSRNTTTRAVLALEAWILKLHPAYVKWGLHLSMIMGKTRGRLRVGLLSDASIGFTQPYIKTPSFRDCKRRTAGGNVKHQPFEDTSSSKSTHRHTTNTHIDNARAHIHTNARGREYRKTTPRHTIPVRF